MINGFVTQLAEQRPLKSKAAGSSPAEPTIDNNQLFSYYNICGISSVGLEHLTTNQKAGGSSPSCRTTLLQLNWQSTKLIPSAVIVQIYPVAPIARQLSWLEHSPDKRKVHKFNSCTCYHMRTQLNWQSICLKSIVYLVRLQESAPYTRLAQLVEQVPYKHQVKSSSLLPSTIVYSGL